MTPALSVRPFGTAVADLDLRFAATARSELVTRLLAQCTSAPAEEAARWSLAQRGRALLALRLAQEPEAQLAAQCRCGACGQAYELELALPELARLAQAPEAVQLRSPQGQQLQLRLPTAADLQAWQRLPAAQAGTAMAAALLQAVDGQAPAPGFEPPADWLDPIAQALDAADPLTALSVDTLCPHCSHDQPTTLDLEALLLHHWGQAQRQLQQQVLRLAQALHWSEAQILALPAWRRAWYLDQLHA